MPFDNPQVKYLSLYFLLCLIIAATEISRVCMLRKFKKTILKNRQDMVN